MKIIKGDTLEKQMEHVDRILKSYSYRLHKTVMGIITPYPISNYSELPIDDVVLRYMFPASGRITIGGMFIEKMPSGGVNIQIDITTKTSHNSEIIISKKDAVAIETSTPVKFGSMLTVRVTPSVGGEAISGIWTTFLWVPEPKETDVRQFLIDDLERIIEKENARY